MSDVPQGPDWWQASDDKWYAPELHPDHRPSPTSQGSDTTQTPGIDDFAPPRSDQRVGGPIAHPNLQPGPQHGAGPPSRSGGSSSPGPQLGGGSHGSAPGPDAPVVGDIGQRYPAAPNKQPAAQFQYQAVPVNQGKRPRSTGRTLAIVFGVVFVLLAGGCGVFLYAFRDQIADAAVDFSDGVPAGDAASCEVVGLAFATNYDIRATVDVNETQVESHFQLRVEVLSSDGEVLGSDEAVFRSMDPGEERTEEVFPTITASDPYETTTCQVVRVLRVPV